MPCYAPLRAVTYGVDEEGKKKIKVFPHGSRMLTKYENICSPDDWFDVPCGHCIGCRTDQSIEWSNRLLMESLYHDTAYFCTVTYCPEFVPIQTDGSDLVTGELRSWETLRKSDGQYFMKRLRSKVHEYCQEHDIEEKKIVFYCAGEYGSQTDRPHMHFVLFGVPKGFFSLVPKGLSETGQQYYDSPELEEVWKTTKEYRKLYKLGSVCNVKAIEKGKSPDLIGFCDIEPANYYTMKYVAGYITKKLGARPNESYILEGRQPPFALMSRRPGIGERYLLDHPDCINDDLIVIGTPQGAVEFQPPRYFFKKAKEYDPETVEQIKEKRMERAKARTAAIMSQTTLDEDEYNEIRERNHLARQKQRDGI